MRKGILILILFLPVLGFSQIGIKGDFSVTKIMGPGSIEMFNFTIINTGPEPSLVSIRPKDFDGRRLVEKPGTVERSLVPFLQLNASDLELPPGGEFDLRCRVRIPKGGGLDGSYYCLVSIMDAGSPDRPAGTLGMNIRKRTSVLLRVDIEGTLEGDVVVTGKRFEGELMILSLINSGNVILGPPDVTIESENRTFRPFEVPRKWYPGQRIEVRIPILDFPGPKKARLIIDCGDRDIWISRITFESDGGDSSRPFSGSKGIHSDQPETPDGNRSIPQAIDVQRGD